MSACFLASVLAVPDAFGERGKQAEIDVHRLERARAGFDRVHMAADDVVEQRAVGGRRRRQRDRFAQPLGGGEAPGQKPDRRGFHIAFAAGDLPGKAQARHRREPKTRIEQLRRVEEGVAVQAAQARELGLLEPRDHAEDAALFAVLQLGLEAHHVPQRAQRIVLAQLHHRVGAHARRMRVRQADRLHRPEAQRVGTACRHHFDRQAALEIGRRFPFVEGGFFAGDQRGDERLVLVAVERTIDVIGAGAARTSLVVARLEPGDRQVDRIPVHDRRDGIEEGERLLAGEFLDRARERRRGEGAGGDDDGIPILRRQAGDFLPADLDERVVLQGMGHRRRKAVAVDRERAARRHLVPIARAHHQRAQPPHLLVQQPDRVVLPVVRAERVGADELGEAFGLVRLGHAHRPHLVEHDGNAPARDLPGGFRSGEPPADDVHGLHAPDMSRPRDGGKRPDAKTPAQAAGVLGCGRGEISDGRRARRWP